MPDDFGQLGKDATIAAANISAKAHRDTANKPGQLERMVADYEKRIGRKLTADEYVQATEKMGAASYGAKYTGPDTTFANDAKFQKDLSDRTEMLRLQKSMPGKTQAEVDAIDSQIEAERLKLIEEYKRTRASGVTSKAAPGAASADVSRVGRTPPPAAIDMLKSAPSAQNRRDFDKIFGPGAAAKVLGG